MPSMKMTRMSGALAAAVAVVAALGLPGMAGQACAQEPVRMRVEEATARAREALDMARAGLAGISGEVAWMGTSSISTVPPTPWLQEDPGAKAYQAARDALSAGRYDEAAKAFASLRSAYPKSGYVPDSFYWQAFALYRAGARGQLQQAVDLLSQQADRYPKAETISDAEGLRVRVEAQLARMGDATAAEAVAKQAKDPCQSDQQSVRMAALSALMEMNSEQAVPILKEVLQSRDACSAQLRRQAVFLVAQKMSDQSVDILLDLAQRNPDPDPKVRAEAVFWLSQVHTDQAVAALRSILQESKDPRLQEKAVFALSQQGSEQAIQTLKSYAERADAPEKLRETAIFWIAQNPKAGGTRYLMDLYPKLKDETMKERVVASIGQSGDAAGHDWLLARAKDTSETLDVRKNALFWAGQSGGLTGADLKQLYASLTDRELKKQLIFVASQSNDKDAVDFLMDVAKSEQDASLRKTAVFWLGQSKDPRVAQFLLSLIKG